MHVELCEDSLFLAEIRQNTSVGPSQGFLNCAVDGCSDVSQKRTVTETSLKSPTAHRKILTEHELNQGRINLFGAPRQ